MNYREVRASLPQPTWESWLRALLKLARLVLLLLVVPLIYVLCYSPMDTQFAVRTKLDQLKIQRDTLKSERDKLLRRMEWIKNDNAYLETVARDRLNLQKEGEYVLRIDQP